MTKSQTKGNKEDFLSNFIKDNFEELSKLKVKVNGKFVPIVEKRDLITTGTTKVKLKGGLTNLTKQ